ncbi:MAG: hypothetical protein OXT74_17725 [Candidatus Poribacteria bacterium]|nr:hypothetical protein [Candidatus Poribacteria bacterium]
MKTSAVSKITDAIREIKEQHCETCGHQAKGFTYRKTLLTYYCRKCLRQEFSVSGPITYPDTAAAD